MKRWFLRRAVKRVLREKRLSGDLPDRRLASLAGDDGSLDRGLDKLASEPSWWESFYQWVIDNWDTILSALLGILVILEKEDNAD